MNVNKELKAIENDPNVVSQVLKANEMADNKEAVKEILSDRRIFYRTG